jgi:transcription termination factor Rho
MLWIIRKFLGNMGEVEAMEFLYDKLKASKTNEDFFNSMKRG